MKTFECKATTIPVGQGEPALHFGELAVTALNTTTQGLKIKDIRQRTVIIAKFEDAKEGDKIELEDVEFNLIKSLFEEIDWKLIHKDLVAFADYLDSLA